MYTNNNRQTSKLFVKLHQQDDLVSSNNGVIYDAQNCRVCVRIEQQKNQSFLPDIKPKWWKAIVKSNAEQWKDLTVESIFPPETSNRCIASECLPMLINGALEGASTCLACSSSDSEVSDRVLYGKTSAAASDNKSLIATSVSWLFDLIDTFRVTRSSVRFSVRVSAVRLSINNAEITTVDLLEHIAQDGSSGDIPKLLGIGRISGPRELRASSSKQTLAYVDAAIKAASQQQQKGIFVFSLNVYQYQIERQPNGSETISGGRGQFHFVDFSKVAVSQGEDFSKLQEKVVGSLSKNLPSSNLPTAFASLTGQIMREFQRCRLCHFLAIVSAKDANSRKVLDLFDVPPSQPPQQPSSKRTSPLQQTSASYDSATLPRLASFSDSQNLSSSITGRLSHCVSGSELSIHTVIHRPSPTPPSMTMQTSFTSQTSNGAPPSLATSNFSSSFTRPSYYSDSESESVSRLSVSLAPMKPLDFQRHVDSDDEESGFQQQSNTGNSCSANCTPAKPKPGQNKEKDHHKSSKYQRLKRFASARMKRQMEQQKMWAMMSSKVPEKQSGGEIWIDGPGAMMSVNKLQRVEDWIDGPMQSRNNVAASNPQFQQQLCNQLTLESQLQRNCNANRSLPRTRRQPVQPQPSQVAMRSRSKPGQGRTNRPPSISCSSENLFFDSGYYPAESKFSHKQNVPFINNNHLQRPMDPLVENVDLNRFKNVTWAPQRHHQQQQSPARFLQTPADQILRPNLSFIEAKKVQQSPFMRLKNKILGRKPQRPVGGTVSVPSSPAVLTKRQPGHHLSGLVVPPSNPPQQQQIQTNNNRISRLTDTSDSGNDSGVALFVGPSGLKVAATTSGPEDALSTTKSLSSSSSPQSPGGVTSSSNSNQKTTTALSSGSVCSHSSGRGSSSSLLSHSVGGSQPSIAETSEMLVKMVQQWPNNAAALSSVEEELASAVSALHQTLIAPNTSVQQQQQQKQRPLPTSKIVAHPATLLTPHQQRRNHLKLDMSEVSDSPSRDELLCLESLEHQLLS